jgi:hypothetical protein
VVEEPDIWKRPDFPFSIFFFVKPGNQIYGFSYSLDKYIVLARLSLPSTSVTWPACRVKTELKEALRVLFKKKNRDKEKWWDDEWRVLRSPASVGYYYILFATAPSLFYNDGRLLRFVIVIWWFKSEAVLRYIPDKFQRSASGSSTLPAVRANYCSIYNEGCADLFTM